MGAELGEQVVESTRNWVHRLHFLGARPALERRKWLGLSIEAQAHRRLSLSAHLFTGHVRHDIKSI